MSRLAYSSLLDGVDSPLLTPCDREYIASLRSPKRQREVASWRALLRQTLLEMGCEQPHLRVSYRDGGGPFLEGSKLAISASHSARGVAVVVSESPCGVDVESLDRDFERVASRYTTPQEREIVGDDPHSLALIWSAKETLFKVAGGVNVDFVRDVKILAHCRESQRVVGWLGAEYQLNYKYIDNSVVVWI